MIGQKNFLDSMQPTARNEFNQSAKGVLQYAYTEDCNFSCRASMEDGICFILFFVIQVDHFVNDDMLEDGSSGFYGILDGHGGGEVVKFCNKSVPEVYSLFIAVLIN